MEFFIATNNAHKVKELEGLFPGVVLRTPSDAGLEFDYEEIEETFLGNSMGKAAALFSLVHAPVIADDSGLCVDALGGRPGVRSARYGSRDEGETKLSALERNELLLQEMASETNRSCRFVCAMCLLFSPDRYIAVQETCEGLLLTAPRGQGGFGYDPLFFVTDQGLSMAELSPERKNVVSHRGRAAVRVRAALAAQAV